MIWLYGVMFAAAYFAIGGLVLRLIERAIKEDLPGEAAVMVLALWPLAILLSAFAGLLWLVAPNLFKHRPDMRPHIIPPPPPPPTYKEFMESEEK